MATTAWPLYRPDQRVRCFNCGQCLEQAAQGMLTTNQAGHGAWRQGCQACAHATFYDVRTSEEEQMSQEYDDYITSVAEAYLTEFGECPLDIAWSQTAYEDLDAPLREAHTWSQFHADILDAIEDLTEPGQSTRR